MRIKTIAATPASVGVVGKLKIGEKTEKGLPTSLDYFLPAADAQYVKLFKAAYGDRPSVLTVTFLTDDPEQAVETFFELRGSDGKRIAKGDGATFYVATEATVGGKKMIVDQAISPQDVKGWMNTQAARSGTEWKTVATMRVALPRVPVIGVWEVRTQGTASSIKNLTAAVDQVHQMAGRLAGIPFDLSVKMVKSDKAGSKSRFPVLSLMANISVDAIEQVAALPTGFHGLLTEQRMQELSSGHPVARLYIDEPDIVEYAEAEDVLAPWMEYINACGIHPNSSLSDLSEFVRGLRKSNLDKQEITEAFQIVQQWAQNKGYQWSKDDQQFVR
jgi:Recombination directionality factor-like